MSSAKRRNLPAKPSKEHLRKQAKRLAAASKLRLTDAQRRLAVEYGQRDWAELLRAVDAALGAVEESKAPLSPLSAAAARADLDTVRELLNAGAAPDGGADETDAPLWHVCNAEARADRRVAVAAALLDAGAHVRRGNACQRTAIHAAAARGPRRLVELLIRRGAFTWQTDMDGHDALAHARDGNAPDKADIVALLDRPVMRDPLFRAAVGAIHRGDAAALERLLGTHPRLLRERAVEPECYPRDYFRDPKLFWFVANNPALVKAMPPNLVAVARTMLVRGVDKRDLDYTLALAMSGNALGELQTPLVAALIDAGAEPTPDAIDAALGHREAKPVEALLARGFPLDAAIAAALGRDRELARLLHDAAPAQCQRALGLAVINGRHEAARLCLEAGADANAFLPVHKHSTPLHQAALDGDLAMMKLLVSHGARNDIRDTLWNGTPLGWAVHNGRREAEAYLRAAFGP